MNKKTKDSFDMRTFAIQSTNKTLYSYLTRFLAEKLGIGDVYELCSNTCYDVLRYNLSLSPLSEKEFAFQHRDNRFLVKLKRETVGDTVIARTSTLLITAVSPDDRVETDPREALNALISDAREYHHHTVSDFINVNICNFQGKWEKTTKIKKRAKESVYLPDETVDFMFGDLRTFYERERTYARLGIPYKRTYLFFGPPGTGKTTFIKMLASVFDKSIGIINLSYYFSNESLINAISNFDADYLVIEDFEQIVRDSKASPSAIINTIDGILNREGLVMFLTTNNIERLGEVVTRPGRVDKILEIGFVTPEVVEKMFTRFFPEQVERLGRFQESVPKKTTTAKLENFFLRHLDCEDITKFSRELFTNELEDGRRKTMENKYESYTAMYS
jgi:energy-coupling factor transporter ATP-binding protein EcfA2